jgi:hypothetical protein
MGFAKTQLHCCDYEMVGSSSSNHPDRLGGGVCEPMGCSCCCAAAIGQLRKNPRAPPPPPPPKNYHCGSHHALALSPHIDMRFAGCLDQHSMDLPFFCPARSPALGFYLITSHRISCQMGAHVNLVIARGILAIWRGLASM